MTTVARSAQHRLGHTPRESGEERPAQGGDPVGRAFARPGGNMAEERYRVIVANPPTPEQASAMVARAAEALGALLRAAEDEEGEGEEAG